ncbi:uncharacterized protein LOC124152362 [Haliotis rufescens]|uniref:uncharacterized protein LOC124152362 n=1 Tax=Haliotis rufescens TaxID=6454 RepID=UPI001EB03DDB|nr:uncharacterized protein LOC124152362 [Haliotis rufescens]
MMADTESLSVSSESSISQTTKDTGETTQTGSDGTNVPLSVVALNQQAGYFRAQQKKLPELPSQRFKHSVWHELRDSSVKGDELKAPRVRKGPDGKERTFYELRDEEDNLIHHSLTGRERTRYRDQAENWETAKFASITYQELQDKYQKKNMERILGRLKQVVHLNLMHNAITSLSHHSFPQCEYLNVNNNYMYSMKNLPSIPRIKHLLVVDNNIEDLQGLKKLRSSNLEELYLSGNPVTFISGYRHRVFKILPHLRVLDGIPRLKSDDDSEPEEEKESPRTCVVS